MTGDDKGKLLELDILLLMGDTQQDLDEAAEAEEQEEIDLVVRGVIARELWSIAQQTPSANDNGLEVGQEQA